MATEVRLPQLGKTMEEGTIIKCLVKVGDKVGRGDILFEIETDKAMVEMESPDSGFVRAILVQKGQTVAVHEPLLILGNKDEQVLQIQSKRRVCRTLPRRLLRLTNRRLL
jgi:pyruvate dehydrogenase E2 component (dihydrolipoamide acetyltransferase)